jgi:uncharacterized protein (UPF0333 family)
MGERSGPYAARRAQSSMEYLLITAFVFLILAGILVVAYSQTATFTRDVTAAQLQKVGNQITDAANAVYYVGPPAKKTIRLYFPELINSIQISNQSIVFTVQGNGGTYEYAVYASTNMTGSLRTFAGTHVIEIEALDNIVNITDR